VPATNHLISWAIPGAFDILAVVCFGVVLYSIAWKTNKFRAGIFAILFVFCALMGNPNSFQKIEILAHWR
jgi:hypothetical protein